MTKALLFFLLVFLTVKSSAQNGTKDLIYGKTVKDFIVLKPSFGSPGSVDIVVDKLPDNTINKSLPDKMTLKMRPGDRELNVLSTFFNPLNFTVMMSDSTFADENFASLGKFMDAVSTMLNSLNDSAAINDSKKNGNPEADQFTVPENASTKDILTLLKNPELVEWRFQYRVAKIEYCLPDMKDIVVALFGLDVSFYRNSTSSFEALIQSWLKNLKNASSQEDFKKQTDAIDALLAILNDINKADEKNVSDLGTFTSKLKLNDPPKKNLYCEDFAEYTKNLMVKIKSEYDSKHAIRMKLIAAITELQKTCQAFLNKIDKGLVHIGRYPVEEEKVHEIIVTFKPREVKFDYNTITITDLKPITSNKIYLRASHFLVPEFATGLFYTNLTYPKYGVDSTNHIENASDEHYPVVIASHLNLVINGFDGPVVPMIQIGVGTAKERPSLLAGGGLRFLKPKNLAISYGRLWTWKKQLNTLKVGDKVGGTAALEKDLKFFLDNHTSYYIGLQYNF